MDTVLRKQESMGLNNAFSRELYLGIMFSVAHAPCSYVDFFFWCFCYVIVQFTQELKGCFINFGHTKMQQWWSCICGLGCSGYLLLTSLWPAPTYSGDEWNFVCGTHSQGCNLHNRILTILLKFLFSWILYQDCPSTCVPRSCKRCISEIPQRNFLSFPKAIHLALRIHWMEHGTHIAADIPMNRFPFVTYWPS